MWSFYWWNWSARTNRLVYGIAPYSSFKSPASPTPAVVSLVGTLPTPRGEPVRLWRIIPPSPSVIPE